MNKTTNNTNTNTFPKSNFGDDYEKWHEDVKSGKIVLSPSFLAAVEHVKKMLKARNENANRA